MDFTNSIKVLLDVSIDYESLNRIREVASGTYGVRKIHSLKSRSSGKFIFIKNPFITLEKRKGLRAAELLVTHRIDKLITRESIAKKSAFYVLEDAYVEFGETDADTVEDIIEEIKTKMEK